MTKEFVLEHYGKESEKYECLKEEERRFIIKLLREFADDIEESSMINPYKLDKVNECINEYNNYRKLETEAKTVYNIVKTLEN